MICPICGDGMEVEAFCFTCDKIIEVDHYIDPIELLTLIEAAQIDNIKRPANTNNTMVAIKAYLSGDHWPLKDLALG